MGVFWGFVLVVFDFRVFGWNLIPDFVGFVVIAAGLADLCEVHGYFEKGRGLALALVVIALPEIVEVSVPVQPGNPTITVNLLWPAILLMNCVALVMTWFVLKGVIELAHKEGLASFGRETLNILYLFVGVELFGLSFALLFHLFGAWLLSFVIFAILFLLLFGIPAIMSLILSILILNIYYKASKKLELRGKASDKTGTL
jgi:hypothetical protein